MRRCKLHIIEGFDRIGKDTLLDYIDKETSKLYGDTLVYKQHNCPPDYHNKDEFVKWLDIFIRNQVLQLCELAKSYDDIYMARLLISDQVYSMLFHRDCIVEKYYNKILETFYKVDHTVLLFKDYDEYLKRLERINDDVVEYDKTDFDRINNFYCHFGEKSNAKILKLDENYSTREVWLAMA